MIVSDKSTETALSKKAVSDLRARLDEAVLARMQACGELEPYSEDWNTTYFEASKPINAIKDEWRDRLWLEYQRLWGKNASGSYFLPHSALSREERMSVHRVSQRLSLAV